jgi:hypothetical protein
MDNIRDMRGRYLEMGPGFVEDEIERRKETRAALYRP